MAVQSLPRPAPCRGAPARGGPDGRPRRGAPGAAPGRVGPGRTGTRSRRSHAVHAATQRRAVRERGCTAAPARGPVGSGRAPAPSSGGTGPEGRRMARPERARGGAAGMRRPERRRAAERRRWANVAAIVAGVYALGFAVWSPGLAGGARLEAELRAQGWWWAV